MDSRAGRAVYEVAGRLPVRHTRWNERYGWHAAFALVSLSLGLLLFAALAEQVTTDDPLVRWDVRFNHWLNNEAWGPLVRFFEAVTIPGNTIFLVAVVLTTVVLLNARGLRADATLVALAFAGAAVGNLVIKVTVERPRPEFSEPGLTLDAFSFPSAHAMVSISVYGALTIVLFEDVRDALRRTLVFLGLGVLLGLIGFSRIYLGAHYFSDVLAGLSLGAAWLAICVLALTAYEVHLRHERDREAPARSHRALPD